MIELKLDIAKDELSCMLEDYNMFRCFAGGGNGDVGDDRHAYAASSDDLGTSFLASLIFTPPVRRLSTMPVPSLARHKKFPSGRGGRPIIDKPLASSLLLPDRTEARSGRHLQSHAPDVHPSVIRSSRPLHGVSSKGGICDDDDESAKGSL